MKRLLLAILFLFTLAPAFAQAPPPVPNLPDTERRIAYTISGTTCACAVNFAIYGDSTDVDEWIQVWINGVRKLSTDPTYGWSLSSATGDLATIPRPITDAVLTFNSTQTGTIQIVGSRRPRRTTQFTENRGVAARDLNQALTDIIATLREQWDKINDATGRGLFTQPGNTMGPLPSPASCANLLLGFDATGLNPQCVNAAGTGVLNPSQQVPTNAALAASTIAQYPLGVWRKEQATGIGGPPVFFNTQAGTCAGNGLVNDGGSCTNDASGNSFVALLSLANGVDARVWGVSTSNSDNTTQIQNALNWAKTNHSTIWQQAGVLTYNSAPLDFSGTNASWRCLGGGSTLTFPGSSPTAQTLGCVLKWTGGGAPSGGYMATVVTPNGGATSTYLRGVHVVGLSFDCNGVANGALKVATVNYSEFEWLYAHGCVNNSSHVFDFDVIAATTSNYGDNVNSERNRIAHLYCDQSSVSYTTPCFLFNGDVGVVGGARYGNFALNTDIVDLQCFIQASNTNCLDDVGVDNNTFHGVDAQMPASSPGAIIHVGVATDGSGHYFGSTNEIFEELSGNGNGAFTVDGTATGCSVGTTCPTGIQFNQIDQSNMPLVPVTLGAGVRPFIDVTWGWKNNTAQPLAPFPTTPTIVISGGTGTGYSITNHGFRKRGSEVCVDVLFVLNFSSKPNSLTITLPVNSGSTQFSGTTIPAMDTSTQTLLTGEILSGASTGSLLLLNSANINTGDSILFGYGCYPAAS